MNFCPNCGNKLQSSFNFCGSCGMSIKGQSPPETPAQEPSRPESSASAPAQGQTGEPVEIISTEAPAKPVENEGYARQLVGEKYPYYAQKWQAIIPEQSKIISLNWPALLFGTAWYAYRKMHFAWLIQFAIIIVFSFLEFIFGELNVFFTAQLGLQVSLGLIGNYLYMMHIRKNAKEISLLSNPDLINIELGKRGGTSYGYAFGLVFAAFVFQVIVWIALDI